MYRIRRKQNALIIKWKKIKKDKIIMKKIIKYVDILIITINFRLNNPIFK